MSMTLLPRPGVGVGSANLVGERLGLLDLTGYLIRFPNGPQNCTALASLVSCPANTVSGRVHIFRTDDCVSGRKCDRSKKWLAQGEREQLYTAIEGGRSCRGGDVDDSLRALGQTDRRSTRRVAGMPQALSAAPKRPPKFNPVLLRNRSWRSWRTSGKSSR